MQYFQSYMTDSDDESEADVATANDNINETLERDGIANLKRRSTQSESDEETERTRKRLPKPKLPEFLRNAYKEKGSYHTISNSSLHLC
jgi:hypothetical protein